MSDYVVFIYQPYMIYQMQEDQNDTYGGSRATE